MTMIGKKRKRGATPVSLDGLDEASSPVGTPEPTVALQFNVQYLKNIWDTPKKMRVNRVNEVDWSKPKEEAGFTASDSQVVYSITPGLQWEKLKRYKNFVMSDNGYAIGDYVYVNYGDKAVGEVVDEDDEHNFWIAKILEIRASDSSNVFVRVYWMYWPDELPRGREYYHGRSELVGSNHLEIIDAMTVSEKAQVTILEESEDSPAATGLYWRQKFDFVTKKLAPLKTYCTCKRFHNPDRMLIHCPNSLCLKWMHEDCLLQDAMRTTWDELRQGGSGEAEDDKIGIKAEIGVSRANRDKIHVKKSSNTAKSHRNSIRRIHGRNGSPKLLRSKNYRGNSSKAKSELSNQPWKDCLEAKLEVSMNNEETFEDGEEVLDFTGRVSVTYRSGSGEETYQQEMSCLFCHRSLASPSFSEKTEEMGDFDEEVEGLDKWKA